MFGDMVVAVIRWATSMLCVLCLQIVGLILVPVALIGLGPKAKRLPRWAWLWDNQGDTINGDGPWVRRWNGDSNHFWPRFRWLALRNRTHNLCTYFFGEQPPKTLSRWVWTGDGVSHSLDRHLVPAPSDTDGVSGVEWITATAAFQLYIVARLSKRRCLRMLVGWKLWRLLDDQPAAIECMINPWFAYGRKK